jgi:hypothetical protein
VRPDLGFVCRSVDRLPYSLFLVGRLTDVFLFGLPILVQIASPIATVILCIYSDNGIDSALVTFSTPASWPSHWSRGTRLVRRLPHTMPAAVPALAGYIANSLALTPHQLAHPLRRPVFAVITRDFTEKDAIASYLRVFVHAMAHTAFPINRSSTRLCQARPRARAYYRPSIGLPLHRPFGPQRRCLWCKPPASNMPSNACT